MMIFVDSDSNTFEFSGIKKESRLLDQQLFSFSINGLHTLRYFPTCAVCIMSEIVGASIFSSDFLRPLLFFVWIERISSSLTSCSFSYL